MTAGLLAGAVEHTPLDGHDGRSGATLERVVLRDGTRVVVKRSDPRSDVTVAASDGRPARERELWAAGVLDALPAGVGHAILDACVDGDEVVVVMRDVSGDVVGWTRRLTRDDARRVLGATADMHEAFAARGRAEAACDLASRVRMLTPRGVGRVAGDHPLAHAVLRGWTRFAEIVTDGRRDAVLALLDDPSPLVARLALGRQTLLHGDLWLVNLALTPDEVVLLDWNLATWGPPCVEFASFLAGNASQVDATRDEVTDDFRRAYRDEHDEDALRAGLVFGLLELGWNKALDAAEHPDPGKRATERADLDWWLRAAEPGLSDL